MTDRAPQGYQPLNDPEPMTDTLRPTSSFRWRVSYGSDDVAIRSGGWPECHRYVVLQQWWMNTMLPGPQGEWRDVPLARASDAGDEPPPWDCACSKADCPYCGPRLALIV